MNRAERRSKQVRHAKRSMLPQNKPVTMSYGHDETRIVVQFSQAVMDIALTPEQCDEMMAALVNAKETLAQHRATHG